jgi:glutamine cyclotransferase
MLATRLVRPHTLVSAAQESSSPQVWGFQVIDAYPHDPNAYTQGLVYIADGFLEGTGLRGQSDLRETVLETGEVLRQVPLADEYFGEGIALVDDRIYQITWQEERAFLYERETFEKVAEFRYQGEGWGLTWNEEHLVMSNGSNVIVYRDPETFDIVREIAVMAGDRPVDRLNELEWIDDEIWANVYQSDWIARIDPESGQVRSWVDLRGLLPLAPGESYPGVLNGIAWDAEGERLFVTGKLWPTLFHIELLAFQ